MQAPLSNDAKKLYEFVPTDGRSVGNKALRVRLHWRDDTYLSVRQELLDAGLLRLGRGRGGSVRRAGEVEQGVPTGGDGAVTPRLEVLGRPARLPRPIGKPSAREAPRAEHTVHRVRQVYSTSCGVAVVAMLARVSHQEALDAMFPNRKRRRTFYTGYPDVIRALEVFHVKHGDRTKRVKSWQEIPSTSVVSVKGDGFTHWVILQKKHDGKADVIDPQPPHEGTLRLTPVERSLYRPVSYLVVEPIPPAGGK